MKIMAENLINEVIQNELNIKFEDISGYEKVK